MGQTELEKKIRLPDPKNMDLETWREDLTEALYKYTQSLADILRKIQGGYLYKTASTVTLTVGTSTDVVSDLTSQLDGNIYEIEEDTGAPGIDLKVNFTDIKDIKSIKIRGYYCGASNHSVSIQLYNYSTTAWDTFDSLVTAETMQEKNIEIPDDTNYMSAGAAIVRFNHTQSGNSSHDLYIDYVGLAY